MADCLNNEEQINSNLSESNVDTLTSNLDGASSVTSEMGVESSISSTMSSTDTTTSNLGSEEPLNSELDLPTTYTYKGSETDNIIVTVDNKGFIISASVKQIKFNSISDFPEIGSEHLIYIDVTNKALYGWDSSNSSYYKLVADVKVPTKLSEFENDGDGTEGSKFATEEYVQKNGGKIDSISVNGTAQPIDENKNVNIEVIDKTVSDLENYYTKTQSDEITNEKVDKETGKGLSTNDYTTSEKDKLAGIESGAQVNTVDSVNGKTGEVDLTPEDVGALPDTTRYGVSIDLSINETTYVVTAQLKDQDGNNLGSAKTIDLPLESVVVSGSYDATNKKVILTLKDGSTVEFSVADLVSGLQSEITSSNKLTSDLVDDENQIHKFVTQTEKDKLAGLSNYDDTLVKQDIANLKNNASQIIGEDGQFMAGGASSASDDGIAIGGGASSTGGSAIGYGSKVGLGGAVGFGAQTSEGFAGGFNAKTQTQYGECIDAIQLGAGTNSSFQSLQVYSDNIYNASTHTLTVENISLGGEDIKDLIGGGGGTKIIWEVWE